ncbi:MAG: division/cell wall cluster transcriptional repressor MraZ [Bacillota bacterium]
MFFGEFRHTIDDKGRLSLPAKFRLELGERVVITKGLERCLFVFPMKEFEALVERLKGLPLGRKEAREFSRFLLAGSTDVEVDGHGRVLIPQNLREYAGLERETVVIGVSSRVEVWDRQAYDDFSDRASDEFEATAEKLIDLGI